MSAGTQQKAFVLPTPSEKHVVQDIAVPQAASGQILVKIEAAALNPLDWKIPIYGFYADLYPLTLGFDGAGVVENVASDVSDFKKGDRVIFQGWPDHGAKAFRGTFQQYVVVPTYVAAKLPDKISFDEGSTLYSAIATIGISLFSHKPGTASLRLSPPWEADGAGKYAGQSIFVLGGAANVGQLAIQFAKLSGFNPIVTTASLHNAELLKSYGATHVVDRKLPFEKIIEAVGAIVGVRGVDLAYDAVSEPDTLRLAGAVLRSGGQLVYVLNKEEVVRQIVAEKRPAGAVYPQAMQSTEENQGALAGLWAKLPELLERGLLRPVPYEVLPGGLDGIPGGLQRLQNNQVSGVKLVVRPGETR